jgi:hypothetical protein
MGREEEEEAAADGRIRFLFLFSIAHDGASRYGPPIQDILLPIRPSKHCLLLLFYFDNPFL